MLPAPKARSFAGYRFEFVLDQSRLPLVSYIRAINRLPLLPATPIRLLSGEMTREYGSSTAVPVPLSKEALHNVAPLGLYLINTESSEMLPVGLFSHIRPATKTLLLPSIARRRGSLN